MQHLVPVKARSTVVAASVLLLSILLAAPVKGQEFGDQRAITTSADSAHSVHAADLDGDGDQDVLAALQGEDSVVWYENFSGEFGSQQVITSSADDAVSVSAGDLDGDGDQDVLFASIGDNNRLAWFENTGGGSFANETVIDRNGTQGIHIADLDGDGDQDIVVADLAFDEVKWYENTGGGSFSDRKLIDTGAERARAVFAADLDGDGDQDVISGALDGDNVVWYENSGDGVFSDPNVITTNASGARSVYATDLDLDGDPDVLSASSFDNKIAWYENTGGSFSSQRVITTDISGASVVHGVDVEGDGDEDVLSGSLGGTVAWYENFGGEFGAQQVITTNVDWVESVYAADLDGDHDSEVLSASRDDDKIAWYENQGFDEFPPSPPTGLQATGKEGAVVLNWDANPETDVVGYNVYRSTSSFQEVANATKVNSIVIKDTSYTDTGVFEGTEYFYRVTAVDKSGNESAGSNESSAVPEADTAPSAPTGLQATAGEGQVGLGWDANTEGDLDGYVVYRSTSSFQEVANARRLNDLPIESASFTDTGVANGTTYYYRVTAVDTSGNESAGSNEASATPQDMTPPSAPTGLQATAGDGQVGLGWDANTEGDLDGYVVYRSTSSFQEVANARRLNDLPIESASFTDTGVANGTTYYYRVTAVDTSGNESPGSNEASATPQDTTPPSAPTGLQATAGDGRVDLSWDANTEEDLEGYHVYRSTSSFQEVANATRISDFPVPTASFIDDVSNGTTYYYRVTAVDTSGNESPGSNEASATPQDQTVPSAPTSLQATGFDSQVGLGWDANTESDLAGYNVYRSTSSFQEVANATQVNVSLLETAAYADTSAANDTEYFYRVTAVDSSGNESAASNEASAIPRPPPVAETREATDVTSGSAVLQGQVDPNGKETTVVFEYYPTGQPDQSRGAIAQESPLTGTEPQAVSAPIGGLSPDTEYTFRVVAGSQSGSDEGGTRTFTTKSGVPSAPTNLSATGGTGQVSLDWDANTEGDLDGYNVYRSRTSFQEVANATQVNGSLLGSASYTDTGVENGTEYFYRVTAVDTSGNESPGSNEASATPQDQTVPSAPTSLQAIGVDSQVGLGWDANTESDLAGYNVYRSTSSFQEVANATQVNSSLVRGSAYGDTTVTNDTEYFYRVTAVDSSGNESAASNEASAIPRPPPVAETREATDVTSGSAVLQGQVDPNGKETTVVFEYYPTGQPDQSRGAIAQESPLTGTEPQAVSAPIGGLSPDTEYTFRVVAGSQSGSDEGGTRTFTTKSGVPSAPTNLSATGGSGQVSLDWDANTEGDLDGYNVYRSRSSFQEVANATQVNGSLLGSASYTDTGVENGTEYFYRVTAVDTSGNESPGSNEASATPQDQTVPSAPTSLQAIGVDSQVGLGWDANTESDLAGYNVYRSTSSFQEVANATQVNSSLVRGSAYGDTTVTNDTEYFYRVTAVDSSGNESAASNEASAIPRPPPVAQAEQATEITDVSALLNGQVDPNGQETAVAFEYYPTGQPNDVHRVGALESPLSGVDAQSVSVRLGGLAPGTEYAFAVIAVSASGSDSSDTRTFTTKSGVPSAPTNLSATGGNGQVSLDWDAGAEADLAGYNVYRARSSFQEVANATQVNGSLLGSASYTDTGVENGTEYFYRVTAVDTSGNESAGSNEASATPRGGPVAQTQQATEVTGTSALLHGQVDPGGRETTVVFEYYPTGQQSEAQTVTAQESPLTGTGEQAVSAQISGLQPSTEYTFEVVAENSAGSDSGGTQTFTTSTQRPTAETGEVTNITVTGAQFNGTVNPKGSETTVVFEYRPTQSDQVQTVEASESPLTGDQSQSVSAEVTDLQSGTEYTVQVVASNSAGTQRGETRTFTTSSLNVTLERSSQTPPRGQSFTVTASLPEGFTPTEVAQVFYRRVGASSFQSVPLESVNATTYEATIPASAVTERGVEYYARLSSGPLSVTVPENDPASQPLFAPVRVSGMTAGVGLEANQYRMISVPLRLDNTDAFEQLRDDFGPLDRAEWRLLRWNPDTGAYDEVTTENGEGDFVPGHAYWLITRAGETQDGQSTFDVGRGRSVPARPITVQLPPGWSQVANPRPYSVAWSSVRGRESVMAPVSYDPSAPDSANFNVTVLQPWAGYWVYNPEQSSVQIEVPAQGASVAQESAVAASVQSGRTESLFGQEPAYAVALSATLERDGKADLRDVHTVMGVGETGRPGVGVEDVAEPPPIGDYLRVSIVEDETRLAGSLRPTGKEGYEWNLVVSASENAERRQGVVRGELDARGTLPPGFERRLIDADTGQRIPIRDGTFTVHLTDEQPTRHLRLIVGTEGFTKEQSEDVQPEEVGLQAVYPNPSHGTVAVDYQLQAAQRVQIRIYDVLGRQVKTLVNERRPAGHHTVRWNARSGSTPVASGAYIVRMKTESASASRRISIVR